MKRKLSVLLFTVLACFCPTSLMAQTPFDRMDCDHDGQLSRSEFRGPPPAFRRLDRNNDGYITRLEAAGTPLSGDAERAGRFEIESPTKESKELIYVDVNVHLVGPRANGYCNLEKSSQIALKSMDAYGVKISLLRPMPQAAGQNLQLYFEDLLPIVKKYPDRFAALGGGGSLNVMIQQAVKEGRVTAAVEKEFDDRALALAQKGAAGFGVMAIEHFSLDQNHPYEAAPPDHPLFLRLADLAAKYGIPIDVHMEAIPEEMRLPSRFQSPPNPRVLKPNIAPFGRLLAHNRKAKIIWSHLGWDNTGKRTVALTRRLLAENPNLYMSIRIASGMQERKVVKPGFPLDQDGRLKQEWLSLFQEFPDRFLIGSDEIIKAANDHPSAGSLRSTISLLGQLPEELKSKIGYENAYGLYKLKK
jgi:predicted TIM-barrel fold metal-dependent hydrolase